METYAIFSFANRGGRDAAYKCFLAGLHINFYCLTVFSMLELGNSFLHDMVND